MHRSCSFVFRCGLLLVLLPPAAAADEAAPRITQGPMLGGVGADRIRVWARTSRATTLRVRFGEQAERLDQESESVQTSAAHDYTGWVELRGLKPATRYYYQPIAGADAAGPAGSFHTLPQPAATPHNPRGLFNLRFEFACCNNQSPDGGGTAMPTYTTLLRQEADSLDFAILNGDWLYEAQRDYPLAAWREQTGMAAGREPPVVRLAPSIVGVWENYKHYLRPQNLARWHREVPSFFTFDDHELVNDLVGCGETGLRDRRAVFRDVGVQAWFDYLGWSNPVEHDQPIHFGRAELTAGGDILSDAHADFTRLDWNKAANLHVHWGTTDAGEKDLKSDRATGDPNAAVYEVVEVLDAHRLRIQPAAAATGPAVYSIGRRSYGAMRVGNCEFYFLDTRTHRQMHDVRRPGKPGVTMLGRDQRQWLIDSMQASDADFHFVVSSVNFMIPHLGGGGAKFDVTNKDDAWTAFLDERETLIDFWDGLGKPVFVLTGDLHNSFAIKVTDRVWEFAAGPHNSLNHRLVDEGDRPINGRYQYGPRPCEIRWSSFCLDDLPRNERRYPYYCVVQVNNVVNNPTKVGGARLVAYPRPQVIFQFRDGLTGELRYAETISLTADTPIVKRDWAPRQIENSARP